MSEVLILNEADLQNLVPLDKTALNVIEEAFLALGTGRANMPPVLNMEIPERHAEVDVKTAYVAGLDAFAVKISPGFSENPQMGLPSVSGMRVTLSATTGMVRAVMLDNGYLTNVRTAAEDAVALPDPYSPAARARDGPGRGGDRLSQKGNVIGDLARGIDDEPIEV